MLGGVLRILGFFRRGRSPRTVMVCSWCDTNRARTEFFSRRGYRVTHGICRRHRRALLEGAGGKRR